MGLRNNPEDSGQFSFFDMPPEPDTHQTRNAIDPELLDAHDLPLFTPETEQPEPIPPAPQPLTDIERVSLKRLRSFRGLLTTIGSMNSSENFQNRFREGSPVVNTAIAARYGGKEAAHRRYEASADAVEGKERRARDQVRAMLDLDDLVNKGILTDDQASAVGEATYDYHMGEYRGLDKGKQKAKASKSAWAKRRIDKLEERTDA